MQDGRNLYLVEAGWSSSCGGEETTCIVLAYSKEDAELLMLAPLKERDSRWKIITCEEFSFAEGEYMKTISYSEWER